MGLRIIMGAMKRTPICKMETAGDLDPLERLSRLEYKAVLIREKR